MASTMAGNNKELKGDSASFFPTCEICGEKQGARWVVSDRPAKIRVFLCHLCNGEDLRLPNKFGPWNGPWRERE